MRDELINFKKFDNIEQGSVICLFWICSAQMIQQNLK